MDGKPYRMIFDTFSTECLDSNFCFCSPMTPATPPKTPPTTGTPLITSLTVLVTVPDKAGRLSFDPVKLVAPSTTGPNISNWAEASAAKITATILIMIQHGQLLSGDLNK
ncbi:hypothetical protein GQX74_008824 [Glossina fuscipes]|nr:hypothetical protein GQX74_008824 [Glossina fuscipes]